METLEVLLDARALLSEHGLAKGQMWDDRGGYCVRGAIRVAQSGRPVRSIFVYDEELDRQEHEIVRLAGFLDAEDAAVWNNAPERTLEHVLEMFDRVIGRVRAGDVIGEMPPRVDTYAAMLTAFKIARESLLAGAIMESVDWAELSVLRPVPTMNRFEPGIRDRGFTSESPLYRALAHAY